MGPAYRRYLSQVPVEKSAANMNISTPAVWRMRMKLLHMLEK